MPTYRFVRWPSISVSALLQNQYKYGTRVEKLTCGKASDNTEGCTTHKDIKYGSVIIKEYLNEL